MPHAFPQYSGRVTLHREPLNQGGYTRSGTYFGVGLPLYFMQDDEGQHLPHGSYLRASDRTDALTIAQYVFPNGRFRP
jgi:hypothetical protein